MTMNCPGFTVSVPDDWRDITNSLENEDSPFTLANSNDGVGALQFSPAIHRGGPIPSPTIGDLAAMLSSFAEKQAFDPPIETDTFTNGLIGATASFHDGDDFIAVWYVSDGKNIMFVTYVCKWDSKDIERDARNTIVKSVRF